MKLFNRFEFLNRLQLNESRSVQINEDEVISLIKNHCKTWLENSDINSDVTKIYRGLTTDKQDEKYLIVDPSLHNRQSLTNSGFYHWIISTSQKWKNFPNRSKSIICSTDKYDASSYGTLYRVIPYDNAIFGVCPANDIWYSFRKTLTAQYSTSLVKFNNTLKTFRTILRDENIIKNDDYDITSYETLIQYCEIIDKHIEFLIKFYENTGDQASRILQLFKEKGTYKALEDLFDPIENEFKVMQYNSDFNISSEDSKSHEIWTESKCLLVKFNIVEDLRDIINNKND